VPERRRVSVYVDDMYTIPMGQFGRMKMSHMMADTSEELLAMADRIGLSRRWIQRAGGGPAREHFDVSMTMREAAIRNGAIAMTMDELTEWRIARRALRPIQKGDVSR
jgi:hypothetical protein